MKLLATIFHIVVALIATALLIGMFLAMVFFSIESLKRGFPFKDTVQHFYFTNISPLGYRLRLQDPVKLTISCTLDQRASKDLLDEALKRWSRQTGKQATADCGTDNTNLRHNELRELLIDRKPDVDIIQVDLPWIPTLANHLVPLETCKTPHDKNCLDPDDYTKIFL